MLLPIFNELGRTDLSLAFVLQRKGGGGVVMPGAPYHSWRNPLARLQLSSMADVLIRSLAAFHLRWGMFRAVLMSSFSGIQDPRAPTTRGEDLTEVTVFFPFLLAGAVHIRRLVEGGGDIDEYWSRPRVDSDVRDKTATLLLSGVGDGLYSQVPEEVHQDGLDPVVPSCHLSLEWAGHAEIT